MKQRKADNPVLAAEERILLLSCSANVLFVVVEVIYALFSHSQSVLMDAANDSAEMVVIFISFVLTPLFYRPITESRPFGYAQVESVFTAVKAVMMLSVMAGLGFNVIQTALSGGRQVDYGHISLFQLILGLVSLGILLTMYGLNKKVSSPTVRAELLGWRLDVLYSMGLAAAFLLAKLLENTPLRTISVYFDQIVALLVVAFTLPDGLRMLREAVRDIFLFAPDEETMEQLKAITEPILEKYAFRAAFYDVNRTGRRLWASVYVEIDGPTLEVVRLRRATVELEEAVQKGLGDSAVELILKPRELPPAGMEL